MQNNKWKTSCIVGIVNGMKELIIGKKIWRGLTNNWSRILAIVNELWKIESG